MRSITQFTVEFSEQTVNYFCSYKPCNYFPGSIKRAPSLFFCAIGTIFPRAWNFRCASGRFLRGEGEVAYFKIDAVLPFGVIGRVSQIISIFFLISNIQLYFEGLYTKVGLQEWKKVLRLKLAEIDRKKKN